MKNPICFLLLLGTMVFAEGARDADSSYQEFCRVEQALKESCQNYFKRDSLKQVWNEQTGIPRVLLYIIRQKAVKDSIQSEERRLTLLSMYKIREAVAALK
jgi:hypothetical protein